MYPQQPATCPYSETEGQTNHVYAFPFYFFNIRFNTIFYTNITTQ
jgi:hypothetical protein